MSPKSGRLSSNENLEELAILLYAGHDLLLSQQQLVDTLSGYISGDFKIDDEMLYNRLKDSRFKRKSIRPMDDLEKEILAHRP